jgi:predicted transcriptional regulator
MSNNKKSKPFVKKEDDSQTKVEEPKAATPIVVEKPESYTKPINALQAYEAIGGNSARLRTFITKKFSGVKSLNSWKAEFKKQKLI